MSGCSSSEGTAAWSKLSAAIGSETEPNADPASATVISGNRARIRGYALSVSDEDFYRFTGSAGNRVYAATMTADSVASGDTVLDLLDTDGVTVLQSDDDNGSFSGSASSIAGAVLPRSGTFFLRVADFGFGFVSPYDLSFRLQDVASAPEVEPNDTPATAQPFPAGGFVDGVLSSYTDADYYSINLGAGDTIFLSLDLDPTGAGATNDQRLGFGLFAGDFLVAESSGSFDPRRSAALFMTVKTAGTYVISVDLPISGDPGDYRLSATVFPRDPVGTACVTYTSTDLPKPIPDLGAAISRLTVPGNPRVSDLTVTLRMTHANPPDLDVQLTAPGGNTVDLFTDVGAGTFPDIDLTLDQAAGLPIGNFDALGNQVLQPEPDYRLSWFHGQPAGGDWQLTVNDDAAGNSGTLLGFALRICDTPPLICPTGVSPTPLISFDFESGASGFTHSGTADTWTLGPPSAAPFLSCNGGTKCWKTNLGGAYAPSSSQDLISPPINLPNASVVRLSWAMKYQIETAVFDHAWVEIQKSDGTNRTRVWEWRDGHMVDFIETIGLVQESAGWGVTSADVSAYAGQTVRLVFHLDSDEAIQLGGLAVDDVSFVTCPPAVCGNGILEPGEQCDDGAATGGPGNCCTAGTCQFGATTVTCRPAAGACDAVETCTGSSSVCPADGQLPNGASCNDGNGCSVGDTCQNGTCTSGTPVICAPSDQCHVAGTCNPATGLCSNPAAPNGTTCTDGSACTVGDTCQNGTCAGGTAVTCAPLDQCHVAGTCNPSTGACSTPAAPNGTGCTDANGCTQGDTCQNGTCSSGPPVICPSPDQCHTAGTCNPSTGTCSNPALPNGTTCSDGNSCTQTDTCQSGACTGGSPVTCSASDQCHVAGTCNPSTGACSNPAAPNGTSCTDGDGCTQGDACQAGACVSGNPVTCAPSDSCHLAGTCNPSTGTCSNPVAPNGTSCSDGNGCTQADTCQAGACASGNPVTCPTPDQCHLPGTCDPATGTCSNPPVLNGTSCNDGNACTQIDICQSGMCTGRNPVMCTAAGQCRVPGTCDPATGTCSFDSAAPNGAACNDGDSCTQGDRCQGGACVPGSALSCDDHDACTTDTCNQATGCQHSGTPCAPPDAGGGGGTGGCGCAAPGAGGELALQIITVVLAGAWRVRRRRPASVGV
ncbi:MAG TPA: proprotein convertase P-domain-containing protein [Myxococcaceae bacterium]